MTAANHTATLRNEPRWAAGQEYSCTAVFTIGDTVETGDSITGGNMLPDLSQPVEIISGYVSFPEMDTNASPTATFIVGDGTDTDGYLASKVCGGPSYLVFNFDGALVGETPASRNIVAVVGGTVATGASSITDGVIHVRYYCKG